MSDPALGSDASGTRRFDPGHAILATALALAVFTVFLPSGLMRPPEWMVLPFADWINWLFIFIKDDLGFIYVTRALSGFVEWLLNVSANILYGKNRWPRLDKLPWSVVAITAFFIGYSLKGWKLGLLSGGTFVWIALLGQWKWAMETLSVILIATPFAVFVGLALGVAAWRYPSFERALHPVLNIAQSLPHFAYMIPVVIFVGVGPKAGAIVTIIFATPPMIRMSILGLKKVAPEVVESGKMCGATAWQLLRHVRTPTARAIFSSASIRSSCSALPWSCWRASSACRASGRNCCSCCRRSRSAGPSRSASPSCLIAVTLDRCSKAWAEKQPVHHERGTPWWQEHRIPLLWAGFAAAAFALSDVLAAGIRDKTHPGLHPVEGVRRHRRHE